MREERPDPLAWSCPAPFSRCDSIQLAHGGGGRLMRGLVEGLLLPSFTESQRREGGTIAPPHDSAVLDVGGARLAFTTDSYVVKPLFFPGGDIGKLAVCGTVNDLAMAGARPLALSCALILEEGFPMQDLQRVVHSMKETAERIGVRIVTGDTKVVDRGKGDGLFVNTAGIGVVPAGIDVSPARVAVGDRVLISGDLGRHGIAILSQREGLEFEGAPESDCGPLDGLVRELIGLGADLHCLRDLTRGGLAAAVIEIAEHTGLGIRLEERSIPVSATVAGACELLGLDPLYVANEGRLVAFVAAERAVEALEILRRHPASAQPANIGAVTGDHGGTVELRNALGSGRLLDLFSGEQMPRIC